jgi:hypothetical protein
MEEYRFDWAPIVKRAIEQIVDGKTVLIITDDNTKWFSNYILNSINNLSNARPLLPFYQLPKCFPNLSSIKSNQDIEILQLYKLFEVTLESTLFGELDLEI